MMKAVLAGVVFTGALLSQAAMGNLLLTNPGFETGAQPFLAGGTTNADAIDGWLVNVAGNGFAGSTGTSIPGQEGSVIAYSGDAIFQTRDLNRPAVIAGVQYEVSILADADFESADTNPVLSIEWFDSNSGYVALGSTSQILTVLANPPGDATEGFYSFSFVGTAPAGATHAGVRFSSLGAGVVNNNSTRLDGASLTVIPEPTSLSLLTVGAGFILRRRR